MSTTTLPRTVTIRIEMTPDSCLSPNQTKGKHWADKEIRKAENDLKMATRKGLIDEKLQHRGEFIVSPKEVQLHVSIFWERDRNFWDKDNIAASLKRGVIDEISRYIGINDRHFSSPVIEQERDPDGQGFMIVTLEEAATA